VKSRSVRLEDVCEINPRAPKGIADETEVSFVPMSAVSEDGYVAFEETRTYSDVRKGYTYFERGDVLVAKITPCFENGKAATTETIQNNLGFGSTEFHVLRPSSDIRAKYAFHLLWSDHFRRIGEKGMTGSAGQKRVPADLLRRLEIPLPPLEEQNRIAAILDKTDQLRQKRRQAIALLDSLTQSIFLEMFGDPVSNPKGLPKRPLGELIKVSSGDGLTSSQMDTTGTYSVYGGNGINGSHSAYMFDDPQIAIGRVGVYCGAIHITKPKSWITDNALYVAKNLAGLSLRYLAEALRIANLNQYAGRAAQPLISGSRIYPVEILVPTNERQLAFEKMLLAAEVNQRQIYKSQEQIDTVFSSLQHRAFSGQL
jgi:type I restriction enzyme S subunit